MAGVGEAPAGAGQQNLLPGIGLALALALAAYGIQPLVAHLLPVPALVIALIIGIWLHPFASRPIFAAGLRYCVSRILRIAVALLGLRIAIGDIAALGWGTALIVILAMVATVSTGIALSRLLGLSSHFGALAGTATAVCGASAALATSSVLPAYKGKEADTIFVVIAVNLLSTIAMLIYAPAGHMLGMDERTIGILLGGSIHDVAQVVGAGFAVSDTAGAAAVIVKLFRVLLLLPFILVIGFAFTRSTTAKAPAPVFAFAFLALCLVNSAMPLMPEFGATYATIKSVASLASTWGLLIAIAALGLGTSLKSILQLGWRHMAIVTGATLVIFACVAGGLMIAG